MPATTQRVLVLGASGMLGHTLFRFLSESGRHEAWGTLRAETDRRFFPASTQPRLLSAIDVLDQDSLVETFDRVHPDVVVNCVGLIKQHAESNDPLLALPINAMLPHRLAQLCAPAGARLVHLSTDCVFSGRGGSYRETDLSDAEDLYGKSKFIGEVHDQRHAVTLRTSMIGHELNSSHSLVDWFLSQNGPVRGFAKAVFSGLPTIEFARVIGDWVLPRVELWGLYHVAAQPISKLALLRLIAQEYGKQIEIQEDNTVVIDRSLNAERFSQATGYAAPDWPELVRRMHRHRMAAGTAHV